MFHLNLLSSQIITMENVNLSYCSKSMVIYEEHCNSYKLIVNSEIISIGILANRHWKHSNFLWFWQTNSNLPHLRIIKYHKICSNFLPLHNLHAN